jgi:lysophospholipase L1-like esterase
MIEDYIKDKDKHPHLQFINVFPRMLGSDGQPLDIFVADRLHMNPEGYKIWTEVITPYLPAADR